MFMGIGAGGGLKGRYFPERICWGNVIADSSGGESRCCVSAFLFDSAVIAARNSSLSSLHSSCGLSKLSFFISPVTVSKFSTVRESVEMTSEGLGFDFERGAKMAAKVSSVTA